MSTKRIAICDISAIDGVVIPYLWCLLKTAHEQQGKDPAAWEWSDPDQFMRDQTDDEIIEYYKENPPDIFGFSVYVWNEDRIDNIAKRIRQNHPSCLIVYGGPQNNIKYDSNFFK